MCRTQVDIRVCLAERSREKDSKSARSFRKYFADRVSLTLCPLTSVSFIRVAPVAAGPDSGSCSRSDIRLDLAPGTDRNVEVLNNEMRDDVNDV